MSNLMSITFRIFKNNQLVREQTLSQGAIKLGKVGSAHVQLEDDSVSRMHAIIEVTAKGEASIIDLGSTRGTFVNGQKINKATLANGDVLTLGDTRIELALGAPVVAVAAVAPPIPAPKLSIVPPALPAVVKAAPMTTKTNTMTNNNAEDITGVKAIEVAAMLGDSVVDVKHCMDPNQQKTSTAAKAMLAVGVAALATSAAAFGMSLATASKNKSGLEYWTRTLHKPAWSFRANQGSLPVDVTGVAGGAIGLLGVTLGLAAMRKNRKSPSYRIGTAPGVELAIENTPTPDYPLVAPKGDDFVFNLAPNMEGEMTVDGVSTPLSQCAGTPSTTVAGAIEMPIPAKAKIRAKSGQTTFVISAVNKPAEQKNPLFGIEGRTLKYAAGSLAAHLAAVMFLNLVPVEDSSVNLDLDTSETAGVKINNTSPDETNKEQENKPEDQTTANNGGGGPTLKGDVGKAGTETSTKTEGGMAFQKRTESDNLQIARADAREAAERSGILESADLIRTSIGAVTGEADISSWVNSVDTYGPIGGPAGNVGGHGFGDHGNGPGGGCPVGSTFCGLVSTGPYNTIPHGPGSGNEYSIGDGHGHPKVHNVTVPPVDLGPPVIKGDLDKDIIRRYIRRQALKIGYCYESKLLANPTLGGDMMVTFFINGDGTVGQSSATGVDKEVSSCVASVVQTIQFPKPDGGGGVQVNYPFTFHRVGG